MNADITDTISVIANHMLSFCQDNDLIPSSRELLLKDSYRSDAHHTTSWLDHCMSTDIDLPKMLLPVGMATAQPFPPFISNIVDALFVASQPYNRYNKKRKIRPDWTTCVAEFHVMP